MNIKNLLERLENSDTYKEWVSLNPTHYLVHMFITREDSRFSDWQVGYYSKESDKITVFDVTDDSVTVKPPAEVFKENDYIEELDLDIVNIDLEDALKLSDKVVRENYGSEPIMRSIIILQNLSEAGGLLWNISVITLSFKVINVKINAQDGSIISHSKESLIEWDRKR